MEYKEYRPERSEEKEYVKLYWTLQNACNNHDDLPEPVLPDGSIEVIFDISDRFVQYFENGRKELQPRSIIAGQITSGILIGPTGNTDLFGIRFQPAGAHRFLGFSAHELTDKIEDLTDLFGKEESIIFEQLSENPNFYDRINIFQQFLNSRIKSRSKWPCEINQVVELITQKSGNLPISRIAGDLQWSERRLERHFREFVGITPKLFTRIIRFQTLMKSFELNRQANIHDHIFNAGYYDQSHMIRDFREFTGKTPLIFMKERHQISEYFVNGHVSDSYNT